MEKADVKWVPFLTGDRFVDVGGVFLSRVDFFRSFEWEGETVMVSYGGCFD